MEIGKTGGETDRQRTGSRRQTEYISEREQSMEIFKISLDGGPVIRESAHSKNLYFGHWPKKGGTMADF